MEYPSTFETAIHNNNLTVNNLHGPGVINNHNQITNYIAYTDLPKESDTIQKKITAALQTRFIPQALYKAQLSSGCMAGTRVQLLRDIESWIKDFGTPRIFWLAGMAGVGKTAVAWTICSLVADNPEMVLGGSFFCSRSAGLSALGDVRCIVPTLAQLMARQSSAFSQALALALAKDPEVLHLQISSQVEQLLHKPLLALKGSTVPVVFVIDALDECGGSLGGNESLNDAQSRRIVSDMLTALVDFSSLWANLPVKFIVTSRPETHIRDTPVSNDSLNKVLKLHTVNKKQVTADIRLYVSDKLLFWQNDARSPFTTSHVDKLVPICDGLFIVATTAVQYALEEGCDSAEERFKTLIDASQDRLTTGAAAPLDQMYGLILKDAAKDDATGLRNVLQVLASLLSSRTTLSVAALAELLDVSKSQLRARVSRLHAVLNVPNNNEDASLRTLHASFGDYLFSRAPDHICISEQLGHDILAHACLDVMTRSLHFNVSQSTSSYETVKRPDIIRFSLEYACMQWVYHASIILEESSRAERDDGAVVAKLLSWIIRTFQPHELEEKINFVFRRQLLFWLEVMSTLGQVRRAAAMLSFAVAVFQSKELSSFFRDANSFVASSYEAIELSASHIYLSALPFAPRDSLVYKTFFPQCTGLLDVEKLGIGHHGGRLVMTLTGHERAVKSVAYSSDGGLLVSASDDGTVRFWDTRTGEQPILPLRSSDEAALCVSIAPNGIDIASGTNSGTVCLWSLWAGHAVLQRLNGHSGAVLSVAFAPTASLLASGSMDHSVRLWSTQNGQQLKVLKGHSAQVNSVAFSPDGDVMASGSEDGTIRLWHGTSGEPAGQVPHGHDIPIYNICFSPDGKRIVADFGHYSTIFQIKSGREVTTFKKSAHCRFSPDGQWLVAAHRAVVRLWNLQRDASKASSIDLHGHQATVHSVMFSPNGLYIISASEDRTIRMWVTGSNQPLIRSLPAHEGGVISVAVSPHGENIVTSSFDCLVRIWDSRTGSLRLPPLPGHNKPIWSVSLSPDGHWIASASLDKTIRLWDARTGRPAGRPIEDHHDHVNSVVFSPDARWLAYGSADETVRIWDVSNRRPSDFGPKSCHGPVYSVAFSLTANLIAAGDGSGCIQIWYTRTGQPARNPICVADTVMYSVEFSPDGTRIASCGVGNSACIWDVNTGQRLHSFEGHTSIVSSVAHSPDGRYLCTGSYDDTVRLYDAVTGASIATLRGHAEPVNAVRFTPDGRLVSGSTDGTVRVWDVATAHSLTTTGNGDPVAELAAATLSSGWLTGPSGEKLMWVPTEYREHIRLPPCTLAIQPASVIITIGRNGWHRGETWTSCWREDVSVPIPILRS